MLRNSLPAMVSSLLWGMPRMHVLMTEVARVFSWCVCWACQECHVVWSCNTVAVSQFPSSHMQQFQGNIMHHQITGANNTSCHQVAKLVRLWRTGCTTIWNVRDAGYENNGLARYQCALQSTSNHRCNSQSGAWLQSHCINRLAHSAN
jgi:hypothetical protein